MGAAFCDVVYGFSPTTASHTSGETFAIFTNQLRDAPVIIAKWSLLLQLSLDFSSVVTSPEGSSSRDPLRTL